MDYLIKKKPQLGRFYLLPKIRNRAFNVPGSPVIFNIVTATENISAFLDFYLKSVVQIIPHILEDTRDFLSRISYVQEIPENAIVVSFQLGYTQIEDYTQIPHEEGIDIIKAFLNERSDKFF